MWNRIRNACVGIVALAIIAGFWAGILASPIPDLAAEVPPVVRDLIFFHVAAAREGDPVPMPESVADGYIGSIPYSPYYTWGIITNSPYLAKQVRLIVPFMAYEGVRNEALYPRSIAWIPVPGQSNFHLLGAAGGGQVVINERTLIGPYTDERTVLATLVHELIHIQGGRFSTPPGALPSRDLSVQIESHTSAATLEVLAGMCHYRHETACRSFWKNIRSLASSNLEYRLGPAWVVYERLFFMDADRSAAHRKAVRFWAGNEERMETLDWIIESYQVHPWEDKFLPGLCGDALNTGNLVGFELSADEDGTHVREFYLGLNFDDAQVLLGPLSLLCHLS